MLAWAIISTVLLTASLMLLIYMTAKYLVAEKKLSKHGESNLYKRARSGKLYKKIKTLFEEPEDRGYL